MDEENKESGFKVVDRRRFNESGDAKETDSAADAATSAAHAAPSSAAQVTKPAAAAARPEPQVATKANVDRQSKKGPAEEGEWSVDFSSFVVSLATQALMMIGEIPNPESGLLATNFEAARQTIDILAMLEGKTKGNLTEEEDKLLGEVLASLQIAYVRKIGAAG